MTLVRRPVGGLTGDEAASMACEQAVSLAVSLNGQADGRPVYLVGWLVVCLNGWLVVDLST